MTKERERLLFDSNRAIAATGGDTRDLAADGPYHYSSDTYEEETLPLIDAGERQQQDNASQIFDALVDDTQVQNGEDASVSSAAEDQAEDIVAGSKKDNDQGGIDDPKDDPSGNDQDPSLVAPTNPSADFLDSMSDDVHAPVDDIVSGSKKDNDQGGIDDPKDDPSENDQDPPLVAPTNPSDDIFDSTNDGVHAPVNIAEKEDELATTVEEKDYAATMIITQSQEEMTNAITAGPSDAENGPFGLPIYAWGLIGVAGIALVVIGALIVKRRRMKSKTERSESSTDQRTKRRVAIDYGGDGDVDVEELSVVSNISSLSGGTFIVRQDRV